MNQESQNDNLQFSAELESREASSDPQNQDTYRRLRVSQYVTPNAQFQVMQDPQDIITSMAGAGDREELADGQGPGRAVQRGHLHALGQLSSS